MERIIPHDTPTLGAGLIGIGREWGHIKTAVPSESETLAYLTEAYRMGVCFFDTAPSYGSSETRLGKFLQTLTPDQRDQITIATKFGEHWDEAKQEPFTDHSYTTLASSIDISIERLGVPDLLLLHKTSPEVLKSDDLKRAIEYAKERGIATFGASVSDLESARMVFDDPTFTYIQVPFNSSKTDFAEIIDEAHMKGVRVVVNRPFNMGATIHGASTNNDNPQTTAYKFVADKLHSGDVVLTGTKSIKHLRENVFAFQAAIQ